MSNASKKYYYQLIKFNILIKSKAIKVWNLERVKPKKPVQF